MQALCLDVSFLEGDLAPVKFDCEGKTLARWHGELPPPWSPKSESEELDIRVSPATGD